jgi:hypothetical protein
MSLKKQCHGPSMVVMLFKYGNVQEKLLWMQLC